MKTFSEPCYRCDKESVVLIEGESGDFAFCHEHILERLRYLEATTKELREVLRDLAETFRDYTIEGDPPLSWDKALIVLGMEE